MLQSIIAAAKRRYRAAVLADSPVAYWRLGEASGTTAVDEMGSYNGTIVNGFTAAAGAIAGNWAMTFASSSSQYISVGSAILGSSPAAWTLLCWVKGSPQTDVTFIGFGSTASVYPIILIGSGDTSVGQDTSKLRAVIRNDATTNIYGTTAGNEAGTVLDGAWHLVGATYASGTLVLYVDGAAVKTVNALTPGTITLNRSAVAGLLRATPGKYFSGSVDEVAIYPAALSAARILAHYQAARPPA